MAKGKYLKKVKVSTGKKVLRVVLIILLVLALLAGAVFAFVWSKLSKITYDPGKTNETVASTEAPVPTETLLSTEATNSTTETDTTEATEETATEPPSGLDMSGLTMETAPAYSSGELFKDKDVMNILLIGTDERTEGFTNNARGDINIVVSINKSENTVKLVSFSRGIAIKMLDGPYEGQYEWLTNAHRWAGHEAVMQALSEAFKIELDRYVRVNFNTAVQIVDAIGGIDMELTQAEVDFMMIDRQKWKLKEGVNHLTGDMALRYARLRTIDDDWHRIERQRKTILAVVDALKGSTFSELNDLCDKVLPLIQTNLTKMEIAELILYSPKFLTSEFDQLTIPLENSYGGMTVMSGSGGWALDYTKNNAALHEFLYGAEATD